MENINTWDKFIGEVRTLIQPLTILFGVVGGGLLSIVLLLLFCRYLAYSFRKTVAQNRQNDASNNNNNSDDDDDDPFETAAKNNPSKIFLFRLRCAKIATYFWPSDEDLVRTRRKKPSTRFYPRKNLTVALANSSKMGPAVAGFNVDFSHKTAIEQRYSRPSTLKFVSLPQVPVSEEESGQTTKWGHQTTEVGSAENNFFKPSTATILEERNSLLLTAGIEQNFPVNENNNNFQEAVLILNNESSNLLQESAADHGFKIDSSMVDVINNDPTVLTTHDELLGCEDNNNNFYVTMTNGDEQQSDKVDVPLAVSSTENGAHLLSLSINCDGGRETVSPAADNFLPTSAVETAVDDAGDHLLVVGGSLDQSTRSPLMKQRQRAWSNYYASSETTETTPTRLISRTIDGAPSYPPTDLTTQAAALISTSTSFGMLNNNNNNIRGATPPASTNNNININQQSSILPSAAQQQQTSTIITTGVEAASASSTCYLPSYSSVNISSMPRNIPTHNNNNNNTTTGGGSSSFARSHAKNAGGTNNNNNNQTSASFDYYATNNNNNNNLDAVNSAWASACTPPRIRHTSSHLHPPNSNFFASSYPHAGSAQQLFPEYYFSSNGAGGQQLFEAASFDGSYYSSNQPPPPCPPQRHSSFTMSNHNNQTPAAQHFRQQHRYLHSSFNPQILRNSHLTAPGAGHASLPVSPQASPTVLRRGMFANGGGYNTYDAWVSCDTNHSSPYMPASFDWGDVRMASSWHHQHPPPASSPYLSPPPGLYGSPDMASLASSSFDGGEGAYNFASSANTRRLLDLRGHRSDDCSFGPPFLGDLSPMQGAEHGGVYYYRQARSYEEEGTVIDLSTKCRQVTLQNNEQADSNNNKTVNNNNNQQAPGQGENNKQGASETGGDQSQVITGGSRCSASVDVCRELWKIRSTFAERSEETDDADNNMEIDLEAPSCVHLEELVEKSDGSNIIKVDEKDRKKSGDSKSQLLQLPSSEEGARRQQAFRRLWTANRSTNNMAPPEASVDSVDSASLSERGYECTATSFDSNTDVVKPANNSDASASQPVLTATSETPEITSNENGNKSATLINESGNNLENDGKSNGSGSSSSQRSVKDQRFCQMKKATDSGYKSMSVEHHQQLMAAASNGPSTGTKTGPLLHLDDIMSNSEASESQGNGGGRSSSFDRPESAGDQGSLSSTSAAALVSSSQFPRPPVTLTLPSLSTSGSSNSFIGYDDSLQPPGSPKKLLKRQESILASPELLFSPANHSAENNNHSKPPLVTGTAETSSGGQVLASSSGRTQNLTKLGQTQKQDSFDDPNMPYYITKPAVFVRLLRMKANRCQSQSTYLHSLLSRDYSIDEKTNKIFNDFVKFDPNLERRSSLSPTTSHRPYRPHTLRFHRIDGSPNRHNCIAGACQAVYQHHFSAEDMSMVGVSAPAQIATAANNAQAAIKNKPSTIDHPVVTTAPALTASSLPAAEPMMTMSWATQSAIEEEPPVVLPSHANNISKTGVTPAAPWYITARHPPVRHRSNDVPDLTAGVTSRPPRPYIQSRCISQPMQVPSPTTQSARQSPSPRASQVRNVIPVICLPDGAKYA